MNAPEVTWEDVVTQIIDGSHLATGDQLPALVDRAVRPLGLTAVVLAVDLAQGALTPVQPQPGSPLMVEGTVAGRAYQMGQIIPSSENGTRRLRVPILDGTDRAGILRIGVSAGVVDDPPLRRRCWTLAGLLGHILVSKVPYSERLRWMRSGEALSPAAELTWQLVPPRTFATDRMVVTALLEPWDRVAGDAYDYAVNANDAFFAVFDGVGHDLRAGHDTALAITAIRLARRRGVTDLAALAGHADDLLTTRPGPGHFVTAVLATLDTTTGALQYVLAGHPAPAAGPRPAGRQGTPTPATTATRRARNPTGSARGRARTTRTRRPTAALLRRHHPSPATPTASSSANTAWSTSPDAPNCPAYPHPKPCAGSPPPCSHTRADNSRTTPPWSWSTGRPRPSGPRS